MTDLAPSCIADGDDEMFGERLVHAARSEIAVPAAQPDDHAHWKL